MVIILSLLLQALVPDVPNKDVVVTAKSLASTERALTACIDRGCPPDEEIGAALAHAEVQFVSGDYKNARVTLNRTISHVRGEAKRYPVPVGDIWRARGRISAHLGELDQYRLSMIESLDALKVGLDRADARIIVQRIELADASARSGRLHEALYAYDDAANAARKVGLSALEGHALFRTALLWTAVALNAPAREPDARQAIARINKAGPRLAAFQTAAEVLSTYLAARRGNDVQLDALINRMRATRGRQPMLVFAPEIDPNSLTAQSTRMQTRTGPVSTSQFDDQWIDVGFWIGADGKVTSADVLRRSERAERYWPPSVLDAIRRRRYAPMAQSDVGPGLFRVERVTLTSGYFVPTGTRIRMRDGTPRVVFLDLTNDVSARSPS